MKTQSLRATYTTWLAFTIALAILSAIANQAQAQTSTNPAVTERSEANRTSDNNPQASLGGLRIPARFSPPAANKVAASSSRMISLPMMPVLDLPVFGHGTVGRIPVWTSFFGNSHWLINDSNIFQDQSGNVGIGTTTPTSLLTVQGIIETKVGGIKFPDGTIQATAVSQFSLFHDVTLTGNGSSGAPLAVAVPLFLRGSSSQSIFTSENDGPGYGMFGVGSSSDGVAGVSNLADGVAGQSNGVGKSGVYGFNTVSSGFGVFGRNTATNDFGYLGSNGVGVYGFSAGGNGVFGQSNTGFAGNFLGNVSITGNVGIGVTPAGSQLAVGGLIQSTAGGFEFPDGTIQTTAATASGNFIQNSTAQQASSNFNISGNGIVGGHVDADHYDIRGIRFLQAGIDVDADGLSTDTFVGVNAGHFNVSFADGIANTFVGRDAGSSNANGMGNSFFGYQAGMNNNAVGNGVQGDGGQNTFVGNSAGKGNVWGNNNAYFGKDAGIVNVRGNFNTFVGNRAGFSTTGGGNPQKVGGDYNVFVGYLAGQTNTTGSNNTILGDEADTAAGNLQFATAIGAGAVVSASNTIAIGRSDGSDTVDVPGRLQIDTLASAGSTQLCLNAANRVAGCSSSLRYKTNLLPFAGGLEIVNRLQPITFSWKADGKRDLGLGAEDVAAIEPLLITRNSVGQVEGVKYDHLNVVLINAIKQQQALIEQQRNQFQQQQDQLTRQHVQIESLMKQVCLDHPGSEICQAPR